MMLQIATDDGDMEVQVQIVEVNDKVGVLDANHPLAGEDLTDALKLSTSNRFCAAKLRFGYS